MRRSPTSARPHRDYSGVRTLAGSLPKNVLLHYFWTCLCTASVLPCRVARTCSMTFKTHRSSSAPTRRSARRLPNQVRSRRTSRGSRSSSSRRRRRYLVIYLPRSVLLCVRAVPKTCLLSSAPSMPIAVSVCGGGPRCLMDVVLLSVQGLMVLDGWTSVHGETATGTPFVH